MAETVSGGRREQGPARAAASWAVLRLSHGRAARVKLEQDFAVQERFSGLMLPLTKRSLPDFGPIFERYANDLKHESERALS